MGLYPILSTLAATTVKGPDGVIFLIVMAALFATPLLYLIFKYISRAKPRSSASKSKQKGRKKIEIELRKDRKYYPDYIQVIIRNTGKADVDLSQPLLIFGNFWAKRKFRIKGTNKYSFYPLLLEQGKRHELTIDLNHFYRHDKRLKRFSRVSVLVTDVSGKTFGPRSVMLRKTLLS